MIDYGCELCQSKMDRPLQTFLLAVISGSFGFILGVIFRGFWTPLTVG